MKKEGNRFSHKKRKTKKETSNKFESPFFFSFAEREGLINPSLRCREPPCKKEKRMKAFK